jgi:hypothetical protein
MGMYVCTANQRVELGGQGRFQSGPPARYHAWNGRARATARPGSAPLASVRCGGLMTDGSFMINQHRSRGNRQRGSEAGFG